MNYILFDDAERDNLLPFTFTRPVAEIRIGILRITAKWEHILKQQVSFFTQNYLQQKYPLVTAAENLLINGSIFPDPEILKALQALKTGEQLVRGNKILGFNSTADVVLNMKVSGINPAVMKEINYPFEIVCLENIWDIFMLNELAIKQDFNLLTKNRKSAAISSTNTVINADQVFLEPGAKVECAMINASTGPVYIAEDAEVMEGSMIRGPFALGAHATLKMGAKVYGATTIGPYSKVGGEVSNSVIFGYSNKAHDGFLGNSVLGEWCNLGADTNNSNLKNNYGLVKIWNYKRKDYVDTGLQFCGLFMGDHSKSGINTMFNTGSVVGVCSNIFGSGFPPKYMPSFSWGGGDDYETFKLEKAIELATQVYKRRGLVFDENEKAIFTYLHKHSAV